LKPVVVDASVAVKWLFPEDHSETAARLLRDDLELWAPDLLWSEIGNVVWKKWLHREVSEEQADALLQSFRRFPLRIHSSEALFLEAATWARSLDRSFYDSLYLALAVRREGLLVTADRKFYQAVQGRFSRDRLRWIEEWDASPL
jgi:predicted nucleic acid-binding protein